jgi:hypothetical protein
LPRVKVPVVMVALLCFVSGCGGGNVSPGDAPAPEVTPDLSGIGHGPAAALEALVVCFDAEGMQPTRLDGRTKIAESIGAPIVGSVSAQVGNSPANIFEVANTPAEARRVVREARRRNLRATAVGRVWYSPSKDWVPGATRSVESCLARVESAT